MASDPVMAKHNATFSRLDLEMKNTYPKKPRFSSNEMKKELSINPATEALDNFLRMAVDDLSPAFNLEDDSIFLSKNHPSPFHTSGPFSLSLREVVPSIHEVTYGMSRVSASR